MRVARFVATRVSDPERGPQVRINAEEAQKRMLVDGELVIIEGPRRQQLATLSIDDTLPRGDVAVRDVAGVAPSEIVYIIKPDLDAPPEFGRLA
ncbi:MAG: molybdopterin dinucleotide binding domain-containing protein [Gemmatirosa sp.]